MAPTLVTSCIALPPEEALRLWPGKAGFTAPAGEDGFQHFPHLHVRPEPVEGCPPRGPSRPRPGKASSAAGACAGGEVLRQLPGARIEKNRFRFVVKPVFWLF